MKEKPIILSGPMIQAILQGKKTQTRRVMKSQGEKTRWSKGDVLWVKETWCDLREGGFDKPVAYKANSLNQHGEEDAEAKRCREDFGYTWRSPLFMPRWVSRLTLEVTDVKVQQLQEISAEDAQAEGVEHDDLVGYYCDELEGEFGAHRCNWRVGFSALWDSINGKMHSWESNPWVWAISFRVCTTQQEKKK